MGGEDHRGLDQNCQGPHNSENPKPPRGGFDCITGPFENPGYGTLPLEHADPSEPGSIAAIIASLVSHIPLNLTSPIFLASFKRLLASHLLFTHLDGDRFAWTAAEIYDGGQGPVLRYDADGEAVSTERGIGMFGNLGPRMRKTGIQVY